MDKDVACFKEVAPTCQDSLGSKAQETKGKKDDGKKGVLYRLPIVNPGLFYTGPVNTHVYKLVISGSCYVSHDSQIG